MKRKVLKLVTVSLLIPTLLLELMGCESVTENNSKAQTLSGETPELLEPEGAAATYEVANYKNLYNYNTYEATVDYAVTEYAFSTQQRFSNYAVAPGDTVSSGQPLIYGITDGIDKSLKAKKEELADMEEQEAEYVETARENLEEPTKDRDFYKRLAEEYKDREPEFTEYGTKYQDLYLQVKIMEEELRQKEELYELDHAYQVSEYNRLEQKKQETILSAEASGVVGAIKEMNYGETLESREVAIAIGDPAKKKIHCDYISKTEINKAKEVYAVFGGKKYEITYEPMDTQEYNRRTRQNEKTYATFHFEEEESIPIGSYGVIVVVSDLRNQVLAVSKNAIHKDTTGSFVYKLVDEESVYTPVITGMTDGVYTEILEGLSEGDQIITADLVHGDEKQIEVTKGCLSTEFSGYATPSCPICQIVKSPVKDGTCYFSENLVRRAQQVKKGEVLARVYVVGDEVALQRKNTRISRLQQRIAELEEETAKEKDLKKKKENERAKNKMEKEIKKLTEQIGELQSSYQVTEIVSPIDGMIVSMNDHKEEEILQPEEVLYTIAPLNNCFWVVDNQGHTLKYGNEVEVTYQDQSGEEKTATGKVVTMDGNYLSKALSTDTSLIQLPDEVIADMAISIESEEGGWAQSKNKVRATVKKLDQVLVVPKAAVTMMHGQTYVKVKNASGEITYVSFISAGSDLQNYGVIEGLTEGMMICSK